MLLEIIRDSARKYRSRYNYSICSKEAQPTRRMSDNFQNESAYIERSMGNIATIFPPQRFGKRPNGNRCGRKTGEEAAGEV